MKKVKIICLILGLATNILLSQIPDGFSYQAVIRDNDNSLLRNKSVTVEASILRNEVVIFTQIIEGTTNDNGLLSLKIGGIPEFVEIDWTNGPLFIQTRIDPKGGSDFNIETTTQLMSVPYAMAAQKAINMPELDLLKERISRIEDKVEELQSNIFTKKIPFSNYILESQHGCPCSWYWDSSSTNEGELLIINSNQELSIYTYCLPECDKPEFDFSNYTLLLVGFYAGHRIINVDIDLLYKTKLNKYELNVDVQKLNFYINEEDQTSGIGKGMIFGMLVEKFSEDINVELNVNYQDFNAWNDDNNNIEILHQESLDIIQQCIQGKWKVITLECTSLSLPGKFPGINLPYYSVSMEIDSDNVVITGGSDFEFNPIPNHIQNTSFSYNWEYKEVFSFDVDDWINNMSGKKFNTFVMQRNEQEIEGWYFESIRNGVLRVVADKSHIMFAESYLLFRINQ